MPALRFPFRHLGLYVFLFVSVDYSGVAVGHNVLRHFTLVLFHFFGKEIYGKALLKNGVALVFFVGENAFDRSIPPYLLAPWCGNTFFCERLGYGVDRFPVNKHPVNAPDRFSFGGVYLGLAVLSLPVAEELSVGHGDLAVGEALVLAPGHVLRNRAALLLREGRHYRDEQLALGVERPYPLFFKINLRAMILELADGGKAVDGVAGEAGNALRNDKVDLPRRGVGYHPVEALPVSGVQS